MADFGIGEAIALGVSIAVSTAASLVGAAQQASAMNAQAQAQAQQAENARAMAQYNANIARQNNEVAYSMALYQAQYASQNAAINQAMALQNASLAEMQGAMARKQYEQGLANAEQQKLQADATRAQAREAADRAREENISKIAAVRSKYGASGVAFEGSPLVVLAETARLAESTVQDIAYGGELQSRKELRLAEIEKFKASASLLDEKGFSVEATNYRNKAAQFGYESNLYEYDSAIAGVKYRIGLNQAKLVELGGEEKAVSYEYDAQQSSMRASASLISGGLGAASAIAGRVSSAMGQYKTGVTK